MNPEESAPVPEAASPFVQAPQYKHLLFISGILWPHFGHCMKKSSFNIMAAEIQTPLGTFRGVIRIADCPNPLNT